MMELVVYGSDDTRLGAGEEGVGYGLAFLLQYTNFLSLSGEISVILVNA